MDLLEGDVEITEFEAIEVESIKGVGKGANGFPILMMKGLAASQDDATSVKPAEVADWLPAAKALLAAFAADPTADPGDLLKAVNAAGEVDEGPDIAGGKQAIQLIARLIISEAQELAAGELDEVCDIEMLCQAVDCLRCWLGMEGAPGGGDAMKGCGCCGLCTGLGDGCCADCGPGMGKSAGGVTITYPPSGVTFSGGASGGVTSYSITVPPRVTSLTAGEIAALGDGGFAYGPDEVAKDNRTFTAAERKKHAEAGNALPDGSYPIPDKDALRRAAILARSKHGDWKAAERLIARRARELGVPNPLDDDGDEKGTKSMADVAQDATTVQDEHQDDGLSKAVEAAVTKALEGPKAELATLRAELAKVADLPRPGGPVMALARPTQAASDGIDWLAKAAEAERLASTVTDTADAAAYRQLASQYRRKAAATV